MNILALADAAQQLLDHAVDALDQVGAPGAPERQYVSAGDPPADCDLLAVWAVPLAKPQQAPQRCSILHRAEITIRYWQCLPTGTPPAVADLDAAGKDFLTALWAVWSYLGSLIVAGDLIENLECGRAELVNQPVIDNDEGGFAGWRLTVTVDLEPLLIAAAS